MSGKIDESDLIEAFDHLAAKGDGEDAPALLVIARYTLRVAETRCARLRYFIGEFSPINPSLLPAAHPHAVLAPPVKRARASGPGAGRKTA